MRYLIYKQNAMRRSIITAFALIWSITLLAQEDMEKKMEELMKNTTGIPFGENKAAGKYYDIRGFKMYAETYGTGKPLLIIHGNGGSIVDFVHQIPYFSKTYKVIVADSRAQGKSTDNADSLSYEMMADDYAALLDQMKIDSAYVIGWSDGGINGLLLAIRHPEKVKKLAVTGANLRPDTSAVYNDVISLVLPQYNYLKHKTNKNENEKAGWKLVRLLIEEPHISLTDLHKIAAPTLVIGGDHDVIKPEHTLSIAQNINESYLWILPNSGHSTPIVYKDEFNKTVEDFFSKPFRKIQSTSRFF
jgi:pimeloyl-ACP methyl ester carboxylesterase